MAATRDEPPPYFAPGQRVEAFGLSSEAGQLLNGQRGTVVLHNKVTDKVEVHLGPEKKLTRLSSERLRLVRSEESVEDVAGGAAPVAAAPAANGHVNAAAGAPPAAPNVCAPAANAPAASASAAPAAAPAPAAPAAVAAAASATEAAPAFSRPRTLDDLKVEDGIEAFGLQGHLAQYNCTRGIIMQCLPKNIGGGFQVKFSEFIIDDKGELAEKGQVVTLARANCRVPGTGPPGETPPAPAATSAKRSPSRSKPKVPQTGFSKLKKSRSRSRSRSRRRRSSRSRSRRRRSPSRKRRRR